MQKKKKKKNCTCKISFGLWLYWPKVSVIVTYHKSTILILIPGGLLLGKISDFHIIATMGMAL